MGNEPRWSLEAVYQQNPNELLELELQITERALSRDERKELEELRARVAKLDKSETPKEE